MRPNRILHQVGPGSLNADRMSATPEEITTTILARRLPSSVRVLSVTYEDEKVGVWAEWLSEDERACIDSFGAASRRREFMAGRAAARQLLSDELGLVPSSVPLRRADDDAVDVEGHSCFLSIAHSGPHAVAACSEHRVGVDIEHIEPRDPAVARFLFPPEERDVIGRLPYDADAALVLCWSLKEAVLKGRRSGFRTSPKGVHLEVDPDAETAHADVDGGRPWTLFFARESGYWITVALPSSVTEASGA